MNLPTKYDLPDDSKKHALYKGIIRALNAVPNNFSSTINIEGLLATDLFSINTLLGGAIENQTVSALNNLRDVWDPNKEWADCEFKRYSESFPDVRLERADKEKPIIGIELKGWYLLAKEEEPSLRFKASADAMTEWDLLVIYPWSLSNVLSGKPMLLSPYIEQAKYAADMRTYYWENRGSNAKPVIHPETHPYPGPRENYSDKVSDDSGNNFGRIARVKGLMNDWVKESLETPLAGIEAKWWVKFLKLFNEKSDKETIKINFDKLETNVDRNLEWGEEVIDCIWELIQVVNKKQ